MTIDYRRFLGRKEECVLPYLGGTMVTAPERALRLAASVEAGWWRFSVEGRKATAIERVEAPPSTAALPSAVGHWTGTHLAHDAGGAERVHLLPDDELPRFAALRARRWHSGELLFDREDLEGEAEEAVRRAFDDRAPVGGTKGVPATLRHAFALAVVAEVASRRGVPALPLEVRGEVGEIAERGWPAAEAALDRLRRERDAQAARMRDTQRARPVTRADVRATEDDTAERAAEALAGSGAHLLELRRLGGGLLSVTYRFLGERFRAVVLSDTLQVVDAGFCVSGHDRELTLASLPSVVREAVDVGHLVVTDHV